MTESIQVTADQHNGKPRRRREPDQRGIGQAHAREIALNRTGPHTQPGDITVRSWASANRKALIVLVQALQVFRP
jgi:hypothetical protein